MRPIIIGLTVVAFGTSAPELVVSLFAGLQGRSEVAVANVVRSNIFNIGAILGLAALIRPLKVHVDNRRYCYSLTVTDQRSRYLLACEALETTRPPTQNFLQQQASSTISSMIYSKFSKTSSIKYCVFVGICFLG